MSNLILQGLRKKLRFSIPGATVSIEDLFDLPKKGATRSLATLEKALEDEYDDSRKGRFSKGDDTILLKLNIVTQVLDLRISEDNEKEKSKAIKSHNDKIDKLVAEKRAEKMKDLDIEDLLKMKL